MRYSPIFCSLLILAHVHAAEAPGPLAPGLQSLVDKRLVAGAVMLIADKEKVLGLDAIGWADIAAKRKMRADCLFWIASQSKPMAAAALMMLVDEGKVSLNDPVEKYLPEFKGQWLVAERDGEHVLLKKPKHPILVRNLLSHTSGMLYKTPAEQPTLDVLPLDARIRAYVMSPLQFEPGTRHLYANAGINTAARIVEIVSGLPYEKFLAERLLSPLGMKDTTFWPDAGQLKRLAKAYKPNAAKTALEETPSPQLRYPLNDRTRCVQPAGGLFSTVGDLLNFYRMIQSGGVFAGRRILSEQAVQQMTSKQTGDLPQAYGFGFDVTRGVGHGGTFGTVSSLDATRRFISIFLVQYAGPPADLTKVFTPFRKAAAELCSARN